MKMMDISKASKSILAGALAAALAAGCAKEVSTSTNDINKKYIEAWMSVHYPSVSPTGLGVYILDDQPGTGEDLTDDDYYMFVDYTATDLSGNVATTTYETLSQQVGSFDAANYYGANVMINNWYYTQVGILEMMKGMKVGGTRKALIPGWLYVNESYDTAEDYLKKGDGSNSIYTITLRDKTDDITAWEIDTLSRYVAANMAVDSTMYGYYYKTIKEPTDTAIFSADTSYWINYTGRLLNGHVFDTTIEDTAKVHGIWSSSKTYSPMYVTMSDEYTSITISSNATSSGSTTVDGFSYCLSKMRPFEKGVCAFYSLLGYGYDGSGSTVPSFAPLVFEIEVVDEP